ncbi:class I SAM-dependent methyltransferase [Streptomyces albidus (ex Kaewkla and Franco 2022)]|uniref:class I SAM-dependent methyltransferase n=1 Tax=Streptomyces albidus (ex Kaewkla and Franco 2022) TaxID=722709 RepID=UPI0015EE4EFD|nr:class I SAM-dependent methyltransferase [Streptomyces albidus (ex Kaewkla and Franco 2022)]
MDSDRASWAVDRPVTSPFAHPRGVLGRLAGRFMLWTNRQDDLLGLLRLRPGDRVLEVGYGPGGLVRLLAARTEAAEIRGVDPSPEMREAARRSNRRAVREGRVTLEVGTAERTGSADASVDCVVAVNNVAIWPDLEAGVRELHRVLRPGGAAVIAWHGGSSPGRIARGLRLPEDRLERIENALKELFTEVSRSELPSLEVFRAVR